MGPVACVPLLLFAGFFIKNEMIPWYLQWCSYGSFVRYAFEGSLISVYGENFSGKERETVPCLAEEDEYSGIWGLLDACPLSEPRMILKQFDANSKNFGWDCAMMIVFFLVLRIMAYLALKIKVRLNFYTFIYQNFKQIV